MRQRSNIRFRELALVRDLSPFPRHSPRKGGVADSGTPDEWEMGKKKIGVTVSFHPTSHYPVQRYHHPPRGCYIPRDTSESAGEKGMGRGDVISTKDFP